MVVWDDSVSSDSSSEHVIAATPSNSSGSIVTLSKCKQHAVELSSSSEMEQQRLVLFFQTVRILHASMHAQVRRVCSVIFKLFILILQFLY